MSSLVRAKEEIKQEKKVRDIISSFKPFKKAILLPKEIYFGEKGNHQIFVTEFIPQERVFISLPLRKQFTTIVKTFTKREVLNGKTFDVVRTKFKSFPFLKARDYLKNFKEFQSSILKNYRTPVIEEATREGHKLLKNNKSIIEDHCDHLVHTDFAPHNFRVRGGKLYTLDCSAFLFGHKYEELARLLNYMVIHNSALEKKLNKYIFEKRGREEFLSLKLMRIYKIHHLLKFYSDALSKTKHDLLALTTHRVEFWKDVLRCVMQDRQIDGKILKVYLKNRDHLRSAEEKKRQREFAKA